LSCLNFFLNFYLKEAWRQILHHKLRSLLSILGIVIGTAALIASISSGRLAEWVIIKQYESLGTHFVHISFYQTPNLKREPTYPDLNFLETLPQKISNISILAPYLNIYLSVSENGQFENAQAIGVLSNIFSLANINIQTGRTLSFLDMRALSSHYACVIGHGLAKDLLKQKRASHFEDLLHTQIKIGDVFFTIVGVLKPWQENIFFDMDFNQAILIPLPTALLIQKNTPLSDLNLKIKTANSSELNQTKNQLVHIFKKNYPNIHIDFRSPESLILSMHASSSTLNLLINLMAIVTLLVGGIGIMNVLLISITERRHEVGIRKAIGAQNKEIIYLFLTEAALLSLIGGCLGIIFGLMITYGLAYLKHWPLEVFILLPITACLINLIIGIFFGFYPAYLASKLNPIEILKS